MYIRNCLRCGTFQDTVLACCSPILQQQQQPVSQDILIAKKVTDVRMRERERDRDRERDRKREELA
jgi:hypothetical protein